jgi:hypothetical protein
MQRPAATAKDRKGPRTPVSVSAGCGPSLRLRAKGHLWQLLKRTCPNPQKFASTLHRLTAQESLKTDTKFIIFDAIWRHLRNIDGKALFLENTRFLTNGRYRA